MRGGRQPQSFRKEKINKYDYLTTTVNFKYILIAQTMSNSAVQGPIPWRLKPGKKAGEKMSWLRGGMRGNHLSQE